MKYHAALSTLILLLFDTTEAQKIAKMGKMIVDGTEVDEGRYPYQVALMLGSRQFCGGSLVAPNFVLSAAHCAGLADSVQIGRHDFTADDESFEDITVIDEKIHPGYDECTAENDVMVLTLAKPSSFAPVFLDDGSEDLCDGIDVTVMGWGATREDGRSSNVLLEVEVDIINHEECEEAYSDHEITSDMICAARLGKDSCQGDSGGPLILKGSDAANDVQVGIVSWGIGCADEEYPGVYSRISEARPWIEDVLLGKASGLDKLKFKLNRIFRRRRHHKFKPLSPKKRLR